MASFAGKPRSETYPNLSPDSRYLIYSSGDGFALNLFRLDLNTNEIFQLTDSDFEDSAASWSPDGKSIVFQREDESGSRDVWVIDVDGTTERNATNTPIISEQHPRFSSDGSAIIFDSNRVETAEDGGSDGIQNYEIYTMSLDTGSLRRLTT